MDHVDADHVDVDHVDVDHVDADHVDVDQTVLYTVQCTCGRFGFKTNNSDTMAVLILIPEHYDRTGTRQQQLGCWQATYKFKGF